LQTGASPETHRKPVAPRHIQGHGREGGSLVVSADDLDAALSELLDTRNRMTRAALGFHDASEDA
jgi:hypothetical protein